MADTRLLDVVADDTAVVTARAAGDRRGRRRTTLPVVVLLGVVLAATVAGPWVVSDPGRTVTTAFRVPDADHLLGTDNLGRDVLARTVAGGAGLVSVALCATSVACLVGVGLGLALTGRWRGRGLLAFLLDVLLVVPSILMLMVLVFGLGSGALTMVVVMTAVTAPFMARYTRALVGPVLRSDYVQAAVLAGDRRRVVLVREVLPVVAVPLLTDAGARFVGGLYLVASAGFLGFDPLGGRADWATMVSDGLAGVALNPWACLAPAVAIALVAVPANVLVDRAGLGVVAR